MGEEENTKNQGTDSYPSLLRRGKRIGNSPDSYTATALFLSEEIFVIKHIKNILPEVEDFDC